MRGKRPTGAGRYRAAKGSPDFGKYILSRKMNHLKSANDFALRRKFASHHLRTGVDMMSFFKSVGLSLVSLATLASAGTAHAGTCQAPVSGTGAAKANTVLARTRAVDDWRAAARNTYGNGYGIWLKAVNKGMTCQISGSFPKTHSCTAVATPCS
jgi:hypothetical protein